MQCIPQFDKNQLQQFLNYYEQGFRRKKILKMLEIVPEVQEYILEMLKQVKQLGRAYNLCRTYLAEGTFPICRHCSTFFWSDVPARIYCGNACASFGTLNRRKLTMLEKYGEEFASRTPQANVKRKATIEAKYGSFGEFQRQALEKSQQTCLAKYGYKTAGMLGTPQLAKKHKTMLEKYGTIFPLQNQTLKAKAMESWKKIDRRRVRDKLEATNLIRFGVSQLLTKGTAVRNLIEQTWQDKYGGNPSKHVAVKANMARTLKDRYGSVEKSYELRAKKARTTFQRKFGENNCLSLNAYPRKKRNRSMQKKYGTIHSMQNPESFRKQQLSAFKYKSITLQGRHFKLQGYEEQGLKYLINCLGYSLPNIVESVSTEGRVLKYLWDGGIRVHYPDFYCKGSNTLIEIKSAWTYLKFAPKLETISSAASVQGSNYLLLIMNKDGTLQDSFYKEAITSSPSSIVPAST